MRLRDVPHILLPSAANSYRPYALGKPVLTFLLAIVVASEALLVASMYHVNPSQFFMAAVASAPTTATQGPVGGGQVWLGYMAGALSDPVFATNAALVAVIVVLLVVLGVTSLRHIRIQPTDMLLTGGAVLVLAVFLLWVNVALLTHPGGDSGLAPQGPGQYHW